jgi:hypothetical protein
MGVQDLSGICRGLSEPLPHLRVKVSGAVVHPRYRYSS